MVTQQYLGKYCLAPQHPTISEGQHGPTWTGNQKEPLLVILNYSTLKHSEVVKHHLLIQSLPPKMKILQIF